MLYVFLRRFCLFCGCLEKSADAHSAGSVTFCWLPPSSRLRSNLRSAAIEHIASGNKRDPSKWPVTSEQQKFGR